MATRTATLQKNLPQLVWRPNSHLPYVGQRSRVKWMSGGWRSRKGVLWRVLGDFTKVSKILSMKKSSLMSNSNWWIEWSRAPELKSKVQAFSTEQVVNQVPQQHRKVSENWILTKKEIRFLRPYHLQESSWIARVAPVVSVDFCQQSISLLNLCQVCTVPFLLFMIGYSLSLPIFY